MTDLANNPIFNEVHYLAKPFSGLEKVFVSPDSEIKRNQIFNSSIWQFNGDAAYVPEILGNDVGCGIAIFMTEKIDEKSAADLTYEYLKSNSCLGRGNHFIDFCSGIKTGLASIDSNQNCNIILIHTDGKSIDSSVANSTAEAIKKQETAGDHRLELGATLLEKIGIKAEFLGDYNHNGVEQNNGKTIYRKGAIKTVPEKIHILPASLGRPIWVYTLGADSPFKHMPHGTGRVAPTGETKVSVEKVKELRKEVYIPHQISDASIRAEHPDCYCDFKKMLSYNTSYSGTDLISLGEIKILSYVGRV
ncbi:MAG: RtcB family protein [Nanoarchaeota archaeon]|nr:RtcB family protein [Nanoarchaeota archaeon]